MPAEHHDPAWPDKAMFSAMLLVMAGFVGATFELSRTYLTLDYQKLPSIFTDDIPLYTLVLCLVTLTLGILSLRYQAALFSYLGAVTGLASLGVFGLVPALSLLAIAFMVKSHLEGEETHFDGVEVKAQNWPDKAMAASLLIFGVASIAITQAVLMLTGHFDPILLTGQPALAAGIGLAVGVLGLVAAREVYLQRRPWFGWLALVGGLATLGFYLIGPLLAIAGMVLLGLAHREEEFLLHGPDSADALPAAVPAARRRRRRRPAPT